MTLGSKAGCKPSRRRISTQSHSGQLSSRIAKADILSGKGAISGSSSSHRIHHTFNRLTSARARLSSIKETLTSSEIQTRTTSDYREYKERLDSMTTTERGNIEAFHSGSIQVDDDACQPAVDIMDILSGENSVDISHVGGEFADLLALGDDLLGPSRYVRFYVLFAILKLKLIITSRPRTRDYRTRRNRTQLRTEAFSQQLPSLVRAYMDWMLAMGDTGLSSDFSLAPDANIQSESQIRVIDILSM